MPPPPPHLLLHLLQVLLGSLGLCCCLGLLHGDLVQCGRENAAGAVATTASASASATSTLLLSLLLLQLIC